MIENSASKVEIDESRIENLEKQLSELTEYIKTKKDTEESEIIDSVKSASNNDEKINGFIRLIQQKNKENKELKDEIENFKRESKVLFDTVDEFIKNKTEIRAEGTPLNKISSLINFSTKKEEEATEHNKKIIEIEKELKEIKSKNYHPAAQEEKIKKQEKRIEELKDESKQFKEQIEKLKKLLDDKENEKKDFPKIIKERDEVINKLNDQVLVLKEQKRMFDEINSKLMTEIDYMQSDIKRLNSQLSEKDKEIKNVRELLNSEKELSEQRLRKRLRAFAEKETRKEVLLTVKIKELIDIIMKQRDVIENINQADLLLYEQFNSTIKQIHEKRSTIDYGIVDEKLDDIKVDVASISDLVNRQESEIAEAIEAKNEKEFDIEGKDEIDESEYKKDVVEAVRRSLENGDPVEIIKSTLVEKGEDEEIVQKIINSQMKELNIKL